ncbi:TonB-dependent receptor [Alteromonas sp. D210916BOD_24]|uniref:TonB-dependent receptor n=1 Tax=Alteromonas sp. D210916BOD_24 TaxID=3157618 RepID=UPI00399C89D1
MKNTVNNRGLQLTLIAAAVSFQVAAQTSANDEKNELEVIEIKAERRVVNLQKSPLAASVLSGDELKDRGVNAVDQLQFVTPSATVNNFGQGIDFNIRGVGKAEHNTQTTTGVITYRDGVATFPGYFTAEPYYDIERVEILRGPQGTFAGQNATGGAVFVTSNSPIVDGGYEGYISGQLGNYNNQGLQGALNLPVNDEFAARIAFNLGKRDSFYDIEGPYTGDEGVETASARIGLKWQPSEALSILFKTDLNYLDLSGYPADPVSGDNDPFHISANAHIAGIDRFMRSVLQIDYEFSNGTVLRSVSGYQQGNTVFETDLDGTQFGVFTFRDSVDETIYSQEINLISPDTDGLRWILGVYAQNDTYDFPEGQFIIGVPEGSPFTEYSLWGTNPKQTRAVFGQISYDLTNALELQVGTRYSKSKTTNHIDVLQYGTPISANQTAEFSDWTGKIALNWDISRDHFLYGFAASGFRPGGLNVPVGLGIPDPFDAEEIISYEAGWKGQWLNGYLRTQLTAFHNEYDNFQITVGYPDNPVFGIELNTPETTTITGVEAQVQAMIGNFSLSMGVSKMRSELGKFFATDPRIPAALPCDPSAGPQSISCIALEGRDQTYAPDFTFNATVQYEFTFEQSRLIPRLNFGHVSEQWATLFQNEALGDRIGSRNILGGQVAWHYRDLIVTAYGTNLTDSQYVGAINSGLRFMGPPREFGLRITKNFY